MKFVAISDTHGLHGQLTVPDADTVIHAGDFCMRGTMAEAESFLTWFSSLPHRYKIFIAGNHDFYFEKASADELKKLIPGNLIYLNDSGVTIEGINIWGSPIQPWFFDWAFNRQRGAEIKKHWDLIPANTDILVVHGPAAGMLDTIHSGEPVGCQDLLEAVNRVKPPAFICGHIHESYGEKTVNGTHYINASSLNRQYKLAHAPVLFEIPN
ncbi:MAG TPA: metallophosphatase domain-containing protein [Chitinophagales bacterium]|nr:metallophosphatase domain-containing protein [Chitinophagales bacterium]